MPGTVFVVLEAHARCATLYLSGSFDPAAAERAVRLCAALPADVSDLRVDARALAREDVHAHASLHAVVRAWRDAREGGARSTLVTISLQDRAPAETGSGQLPGARHEPEASLA